MNKKKILMCNESSLLSTGYSVYGHEVLKRLHETGKYELAELASYGYPEDPRISEIPWKYFPVIPPKNQPEIRKIYDSKSSNQWGEYLFDDICAHFKPDIVWDIRDWWNYEFQERSPARKYFYWSIMPTVDSAPQNDNWISTFLNADSVHTYSDWGLEILKKQSNNKIKLQKSAPPGANLEDYKFLDKDKVKQKVGLSPEIFLVGTVMRNQQRKLYSDLMEAFRLFLEIAPKEIAEKTYLYLHVSYPDVGWDIPRLLKEHGVSHRTYFTYICQNCNEIYPSFFRDGRAICKFCNTQNAILPNIKFGVPPKVLNEIMGLFDAYVQYSVCLPAGEKVFVNNSWVDIEDVRVGDIAYTHEGRWMTVENTFVNKYRGNLHKIKVSCDWVSTRFTSEHPILCLSRDKILEGKKNVTHYLFKKIKRRFLEPEFLEAQFIKPGDFIAYVIDDSVRDYKKIANIPITVDYCKFIGILSVCAKWEEGVIKIENKEEILDDEINDIIKQEMDRIKNNPALSQTYSKWFSEKEQYRKIPDWCANLPTNKQIAILQGIVVKNGHYNIKKGFTEFSTESEILATQIKNILRRARIYFSVQRKWCNFGRRKKTKKNRYVFNIRGSVKDGIFKKKHSGDKNIYIDKIHYMRVDSTEVEEFVGQVYNFEVFGDNSYCTLIGHCHNCEGFGMPQVEAAASGTPVFSVDYSAMSDVVKKLKGIPIEIERMFRDAPTQSYRALPSNKDFVEKLKNFLSLPKEIRRKMGMEARKAVEEHYTWEKTAKIWEEHFDSIEILDLWKNPANIHSPILDIPRDLSDYEFVNWCLVNIAGRPDLVNSYLSLRLTRDLGLKMTINGLPNMLCNEDNSLESYARYGELTRDILIEKFLYLCQKRNDFEYKRVKYKF